MTGNVPPYRGTFLFQGFILGFVAYIVQSFATFVFRSSHFYCNRLCN